MSEGNDLDLVGTDGDPLGEARRLAEGAAAANVQLRLLGGLAVRVLCPDFTPRVRRDQDIDFACLAKGRKAVAAHLEAAGCEADRRFNALNGERQMYFTAPSGRPIDVMVDQLTMCHTLDFRPRFSALPITLDAVDLLLTKLQIVELNEKDAHDCVHLLSAYGVVGAPGEPTGTGIDAGRFAKVVGGDWGWWRTVTGNLEKLTHIVEQRPELRPPTAQFDVLANAQSLLDVAHTTPKSVTWKMRAKIGDRLRWYELPEEVAH